MNERMQLLIEADKRGILPPEMKGALDEAIKRGLVETPASVSAGATLRDIPRQVGLTARYGAEGLADVAGIVTEPIRAAINPMLKGVGLPPAGSTRNFVSGIADAVGLPSPRGADERVVGDVTRMMAGAGGMAGAANAASRTVAAPIAKSITTAMGSNLGTQIASAGTAAGAGGAVREAGGGPVEQFGASLLGGLAGAGGVALAEKAYGVISSAVKQLLTPKSGMPEINLVLNQILETNGIDLSRIPGQVRAQLAAEVKDALNTGRELKPDVIKRIADYGVVGATPTRGAVTLDPVQITQEKNLAKVGANSTDPKLQELARLQNANNAKFVEFLNGMGAGTKNADPLTAGRAAVGAVQGRDAAAKSVENSLYAKARDTTGRAIDLDRDGFIFQVNNELGKANKGAFLPSDIKALLKEIRTGKAELLDGSEIAVPFNVDVIDSLKTTLASASRATKDGNAKGAIAIVRNALENAQPKAVGRQVGGSQIVDPAKLTEAQTLADDVSSGAMKAFDDARKFARARRNWQESAPGIAAAIEDIPPDRFVKDYILSSSNKAASDEVKTLINTVRKDPQAIQAVKENIVAYLKKTALSGAADEVGNFSQSAYNNALRDMGDAKLKLFFNADEISKLKALGRVASYEMVQPKGSAVNNSNTASGIAGLLDRIANSTLLSRIPFADAAIRGPAKNWSAQIGVTNALNPYAASSASRNLPQPSNINALIGPAMLSVSPGAYGRNDDKRR